MSERHHRKAKFSLTNHFIPCILRSIAFLEGFPMYDRGMIISLISNGAIIASSLGLLIIKRPSVVGGTSPGL